MFDSYVFGLGVGLMLALALVLWEGRPKKSKLPRTVRGVGAEPWLVD